MLNIFTQTHREGTQVLQLYPIIMIIVFIITNRKFIDTGKERIYF